MVQIRLISFRLRSSELQASVACYMREIRPDFGGENGGAPLSSREKSKTETEEQNMRGKGRKKHPPLSHFQITWKIYFDASANPGYRTGHDVVLKITGADSTDAGKYSQLEVSFLQKVREARGANEQQHVIRMLDNFSLSSSFGTHSCLVLEVLGMSLEELTRKTLPNKFPIPIQFSVDLKLDDLLLHMEDTKGIPLLGASESPTIDLSRVSLGPSAVVISDLGVASKIESPFDGVIQPYALRAPEVYLGIPYGAPADIWNLGCLFILQAFELVTYCWLFNPQATSRWSRDDDMLGQMLSVNGLTTFPVDVLARGRFSLPVFRHVCFVIVACSVTALFSDADAVFIP
ncbi:kinase-like domain-containing protein, partial [Desarmillaria tabescens]